MTGPCRPVAQPAEAGKAGEPRYGRISQGFGNLASGPRRAEIFDVVIVGSGYGGSVAAHALAGATVGEGKARRDISVCVLERGNEYLPGEFPSRFEDLPGHLRSAHQTTGEVGGNHEGLFDLRLGSDVMALVANGVGGGSLFNAGVLLKPKPDDFEPGSPARQLIDALEAGGHFDAARKWLGGELPGRTGVENTIVHSPCYGERLPPKTRALGALAGDHPLQTPPISVSMEGGINHAGVKLERCNLCGDCMTGCNVGAKDSLDTNLLEAAVRSDNVKVYTGASVLSIVRSEDAHERRWLLRVAHTAPALQEREAGLFEIGARKVILAAGTLGSTEILLRSRSDKLVFSTRLGEQFSCNGDNLAAVYRMQGSTRGCADEDLPLDQRGVGPTITGSVGIGARRGFQLQEFSVPGPMKQLFEEIVTTARMLNELPDADPTEHGNEPADAIDPMAVNAKHMAETLLVGVIGHDDAAGTLRLPRPLRPRDHPPQQGSLQICWPQARDGADLNHAHGELERLVAAMPAQFRPLLVANPMWRLLPPDLAELVSQPRGPVLTVHPLGGCPIGAKPPNRTADTPGASADACYGVVDSCGRVYDLRGARGPDLWAGSLVVLDGSIIPGSLGVNPSLTIAATALRALGELKRSWGYVNAVAAPAVAPQPILLRRQLQRTNPQGATPPRTSTQIEIVERLRGPVLLDLGGDLPQRCIVELTLAYEEIELRSLITKLSRKLQVETASGRSRLRIYDAKVWHAKRLMVEIDAIRSPFAIFDGHLSGSLQVFGREASAPWQRRLRSVWPWVLNRGLRDTYQKLFRDPKTKKRPGAPSYIESLLRLASRAGEVRFLEYALKLESIEPSLGNSVSGRVPIAVGSVIGGRKRLTYGRRANPWHQLTELKLEKMPAMVAQAPPILTLDPAFLARQGFPLLRVARQQNQARALADLFSFALYMTRMIVGIHLWTFRKPDPPTAGDPVRLPQTIPGIAPPEITELVVDRMPVTQEPVRIRLTHYAQPPGRANALPPIVMIHGYSVSGNTFTHESLRPSAAEYFYRTGRDVWIVDLRTSSGLASATRPWAMEHAGLIDIPAALLHIRNASQQRVDVLAHCIGCAMLSMAILTDARKIRSSEIELGPDVWLTSEQLGVLTAFNGVQPDGGPHPCIRRIVLSQKGPVLRYTDSNVFRAFVLQSARRWLLADGFAFRPAAKSTVAEQLLDRLLSSIPYPADDYDVDNPLWPCKQVPWAASRHRMDALYGRDFNAANLSHETLVAIDDLFGPINLDTVSQTIHFARVNAITNQAGRGEFVTLRRSMKRWAGIPTLAIHGRDNGLVDISTQDLLKQHFDASGVPFEAIDYDKLGHQDVLIGNTSALVFRDIEKFLDGDAPKAKPPLKSLLVLDVPWSGPRLDLPDDNAGQVRIACLSSPYQGRGRLFLVPGMLVTDAAGATSYKLLWAPRLVVSSSLGSSRDWFALLPPLDLMALEGLEHPPKVALGWFAVMVFASEESIARDHPGNLRMPAPTGCAPPGRQPVPGPGDSADRPDPADPSGPGLRISPPIPDPAHPHFGADGPNYSVPFTLAAWVDAEHGPQRRPDPEIEAVLEQACQWIGDDQCAGLSFVRLRDLQAAQTGHAAQLDAGAPLRLALGSCQYPPGLLDREVGQASLRHLAGSLDDERTQVDIALFVGDQIYADATAGLVDPVRRDELFDQPNDKALRLPDMRAVLRRIPMRNLLDDHELCDNWEPMALRIQRLRPRDALHRRRTLRYGTTAWRKFQLMRPAQPGSLLAGAGEQTFVFAGYPFHFADTRTGRSPRGSHVAAADQKILHDDAWQRLEDFLGQHRERIKFVATPSLLLPRRRLSAEDAIGGAHSDAWDGFAGSLERLLAFMVDRQVTNTVFLSGDEHHAMFSELRVVRCDGSRPPVKIVSVHGSALYAPFPFANGHPDDLSPERTITFGDRLCNRICVHVRTTYAPPGDGYVRLEPQGGPAPILNLEFVKADAPGLPLMTRIELV